MSVNIKPYIIINGKNSNEITGLMITKLPPISKPAMRVEAEEIDGRDGDIVTELGFSAYDKEIEIGLYGEYDVNDVIEYFNQSGQVIFSNEPDKYYRFAIYNAIDFEKLINFKTATVTFHVQPFKFDVVSNDAVFFSPSNVSITNEGNIYSRPELAIQGSGNVGISVNGSDVLEIELGASQQAIIIDSDGMNAYGTKTNIKELIVDVNPVQDLHGYDSPWVGGAGANLWGGDGMLQDFINANIDEFVYDTTAKTLTYGAPKISTKEVKTFEAIENQQYTFILVGSNTLNYDATNLRLYYSDGTNDIITFPSASAGTKQTCVFTSRANKTITKLVGVNSAGNVTLYYDECCMLKGVKTANDFVPWENICPITGWNGCDVTRTGANMLNGHAMAQALANNGGTINTSEKTISYTGAVARATGIFFDKFKPNTQYTAIFKVKSSNKNCNAVFNYTDGTTTQISVTDATTGEFTFVVPSTSGKSIDSFEFRWLSGTVVAYYEECGIFEGVLTADDFQRYVGNQYQSFFEGLINGTMGFVDLGTLTWDYTTSYTKPLFFADVSGKKINNANIVCPIFNNMGIITNPNTFSSIGDKIIGSSSSTQRIFVRDDSFTDATEFTTSLSGVYLIYELATPTTPTITQADINMLMTAFGIDEVSAIVVFGQEVFGATINITTGLMTIYLTMEQMLYSEISGLSSDYIGYDSGRNAVWVRNWHYQNMATKKTGGIRGCCNAYNVSILDSSIITTQNRIYFYGANSVQNFLDSIQTLEQGNNGLYLCYELATPIEIQLTSQEIMTLIGKNVLWANTGAINELIYTKDGVDITTSGDIVSFDVDAIDIIDTILKNRLVTGNYDNLRLKAGTNQIAVSGDVSVMVLSNFSRWL